MVRMLQIKSFKHEGQEEQILVFAVARLASTPSERF